MPATSASDDDRTRLPPQPADTVGGAPAASAAAAAAAANNALPPGTRLGEFEIEGLVGQGGFGIVYAARDLSLQRRVALKEYMPSVLARRVGELTVAVSAARHADTFDAGLRSFVNEARLLAQFDHPSLVKVYRFWEANGTAYMVMPLYQGVTLKDALRGQARRPDEAWLRGLIGQLLEALGVLHAQHCCHRDISPDNILLLHGGRPVLLDFGAARRVISDMTHSPTVILKPGYAPIEQYAETDSLAQGPWTDMYALAAVMYFAITGTAPVPSVARMITDSLEPLARKAQGRYGAGFLAAIDRALAVRPADRPQSAIEFARLLGIAVDVPPPCVPPSPSGGQAAARSQAAPERAPGRPPARRPPDRMLAAGAATAALAAAIAGAWLLHEHTARTHQADVQSASGSPPMPAMSVPATGAPAGSAPAASAPAVPTSSAPPEASPPASAPASILAGVPTQAPTPATGAATPAPMQAGAPADPLALLEAVFDARDPGRRVTVSVPDPRARIKIDPIRFTLQSSHPGFVYLLFVDTERSRLFLLFPNALDGDNRIAPARALALPRKRWEMVAEGPAGTDHFVAIVSEHPREFASAGAVRTDTLTEFPLANATRRSHTQAGSQPPQAGRVVCPAVQPDCSAAYGAARFSIEEVQPAVSQTPAARTSESQLLPESRLPSKPRSASASRCSDLLQRASRGDALDAAEIATMQADCR